MTFEENHIRAEDAYLRQDCDATAEATVGRMFEAIGYRPGMVIVPADRIEKLEAVLRLYTCGCTAICENYHIDAACGYSAREALGEKCLRK